MLAPCAPTCHPPSLARLVRREVRRASPTHATYLTHPPSLARLVRREVRRANLTHQTQSVRNGELSRDDRPGAGQPSQASEIADHAEDGEKDDQLDHVPEAGPRHDLPQQPQRRLRPAYGPHRSVKIPPLVSFPFGRGPGAREPANRAEEPDRSGERKVRVAVNLFQVPAIRDDGDDEAGDIQDGERDHL